MKCPQCLEANRTSQVYPHGGTVTLLYCPPFYDESGLYHHHDSNRTTDQYSCSNGHEFSVKSAMSCPAPGCTWVARVG